MSVTNALSGFVNSLDQELALLVGRYGPDAVRDAAKRATKKKRGRKAEKDWPLLRPWLKQDTDDWLAGRDPFALRTNYAIAKQFAEQHPGHSAIATKGRIERKLRARRRWWMLVTAHHETEANFPFSVHLRALRELAAADGHRVWQSSLENALGRLAFYREEHGEPDASKSFAALEEELRRPDPVNALMAAHSRRGLFDFSEPKT